LKEKFELNYGMILMKHTQLKVKHGGYTFQNLLLHFHCNYASSFCRLTTWPCVNCSIAVSFAAFMQFPTCDVFHHWCTTGLEGM